MEMEKLQRKLSHSTLAFCTYDAPFEYRLRNKTAHIQLTAAHQGLRSTVDREAGIKGKPGRKTETRKADRSPPTTGPAKCGNDGDLSAYHPPQATLRCRR